MSGRIPPFPAESELEPYREGLRHNRLRITRCNECGLPQFPPRTVCPGCFATGSARWEDVSGRGRIWSFCVFHKAYLPEPAPQPPYIVAVVRLDEGTRLITNIVDTDPHTLTIGRAVEPVFDSAAAVIRFRPTEQDNQ